MAERLRVQVRTHALGTHVAHGDRKRLNGLITKNKLQFPPFTNSAKSNAHHRGRRPRKIHAVEIQPAAVGSPVFDMD